MARAKGNAEVRGLRAQVRALKAEVKLFRDRLQEAQGTLILIDTDPGTTVDPVVQTQIDVEINDNPDKILL